jgi:uncharacterized delta-60 repeat protein
LPRPSLGNLDAIFGTGGVITEVTSTSFDRAEALTLQPYGKIIVAGSTINNANDSFFVSRYNTDGSLDGTFSENGKVMTDLNSVTTKVDSVIVQPDAKIVVVGNTWTDFAAVRYNTDGGLDTSFGTGGKVTLHFMPTSAAIQSDGKIIVIGSNYFPSTGVTSYAIHRLNIDGSLDTLFATGGTVSTIGASGVAIQPDGKIILAGYNFAVVRYNSDGSVDTVFGSGDRVTPDFDSSFNLTSSIVLQPDGKIILAGTSDFALVRYTPDGNLDMSFGEGGKVITPIVGTSYDYGLSIGLQDDGKIIVTGQAVDKINGYIAIARYTADGSIDPSFGVAGRIARPLNPSMYYYSSDFDAFWVTQFPCLLSIQSDGKLIAAGTLFDGYSEGFEIVRFVP